MRLVSVQAGDVLAVELHVLEANDDDGITAAVIGSKEANVTWFTDDEVAAMRFVRRQPLPRPAPKVLRYCVGDEVYRTWDHSDRGEVKAVCGDKYWVAFSNGVLNTLIAADMVLI